MIFANIVMKGKSTYHTGNRFVYKIFLQLHFEEELAGFGQVKRLYLFVLLSRSLQENIPGVARRNGSCWQWIKRHNFIPY
ncbi:MAG: hypothetical protein HW387_770 [Parachlamydiales bacterium]|nr:hypothetical protein [Parachlamydiales bacterium]